jgi:hypothetical protein
LATLPPDKLFYYIDLKNILLYISGEVALVAGGWEILSSTLNNFRIFSPLGGCNYKVRKSTLGLG